MCGIVGYLGTNEAAPIILQGLHKLEYRGYDSAGICTMDHGVATMVRAEGKLVNLELRLNERPLAGHVGIGHTRWATHGRPSESNAHPHRAGDIVVVHNGIISNYAELKSQLERRGREFRSETDTEVIAHVIDQRLRECGNFEQAVREGLSELRGAFAVCILCPREPEVLIGAKQGSPMVVGLAEDAFIVASDIPPILEHTREMVFLEDGEMAVFRGTDVAFSTIAGTPVEKKPRHIEWSPLMAAKGGYKHFMLKEIFEQPRAVRDTIAGRIMEEEGDVRLDGMRITGSDLASVQRMYIVACGTSWHAALVGKYLIEQYCRLPVEVDIASEFRYRDPIVDDKTLLVSISQSGETADTLAALREGKARGAKNMAVCNVVDSSIAREADGVIYTHAGPEIGVASTKAFVTQLVALYLLNLQIARARGTLDQPKRKEMLASLRQIGSLLECTLGLDDAISKIARKYGRARDFLFIGRGIEYPIALEGALKLKEISYIHAEGYPAGELKHGPIALIDGNVPVVVLAPRGRTYEKVVSNMEEVIARGAHVIAITSPGDTQIAKKADAALEVPETREDLQPILMTVPLQLLAYHIAVLKGTDVDQPRNLAKSVTVE